MYCGFYVCSDVVYIPTGSVSNGGFMSAMMFFTYQPEQDIFIHIYLFGNLNTFHLHYVRIYTILVVYVTLLNLAANGESYKPTSERFLIDLYSPSIANNGHYTQTH